MDDQVVWGGNGQLRIGVEREHTSYVISIAGELDLASMGVLEHALKRAKASDASNLIVDLSALHFIDSACLRFLLLAEQDSRQDSGRLRFLRGSGQVQRIMRLTGVDHMLSFMD
jgi:anti-anti-sigma factor